MKKILLASLLLPISFILAEEAPLPTSEPMPATTQARPAESANGSTIPTSQPIPVPTETQPGRPANGQNFQRDGANFQKDSGQMMPGKMQNSSRENQNHGETATSPTETHGQAGPESFENGN